MQSWNIDIQFKSCVLALSLVIAHSQLHNNMQVEKKRMVARPQAQQNVARCRDGANVFKVSKC